MDKQNVINYWLQSAQNDLETAQSLVELQKYSWALFIYQLVFEKNLKARIVQVTDQAAPITHDLVKLAHLAQLEVSQEQIDNLKTISKFNIDARYDDYKYAFFKQADQKYANKWVKIITDLLSWLKQQN